MTLKIYISTQNLPEAQPYRHTAQMALFSIREFPVTATQANDVIEGINRLNEARTIISECDLFMGIYGDTYGEIPPDSDYNNAEQDYRIAHEAGVTCLIFMPESARHISDERQARFKAHLGQHHVIQYFDSLEALRALIVMGVAKFRLINRARNISPPPLQISPLPIIDVFEQFKFGAVEPEVVPQVDISDEDAEADEIEEAESTPKDYSTEKESSKSQSAPPPRSAPPRSAPQSPSESVPPPPPTPSPAPLRSRSSQPPSEPDLTTLEPDPAISESGLDLEIDFPMMELDRSAWAGEEFPIEAQTEALEEVSQLEGLVTRALNIAQDDIEQIIRRALETHDAHNLMRQHQQETLQKQAWMQVNPIFGEPLEGNQFQADIFMIMPFREHFDAVYTNLVVPTVTDLNLTIKRGDDFSSISGAIMREVWAAINACQLVIVETTEVNANVYYELGIAHTLGKPAILLTQHKDNDALPFDLRHLRFLRYEDSIQGGIELKSKLKTLILSILNDLQDD